MESIQASQNANSNSPRRLNRMPNLRLRLSLHETLAPNAMKI